jgi:hypothetical protein
VQILLTRLPQRLQIVIIQRHAPDLLGIPKIVRLAQILLSGIQLAQLGAVARQSCIVIMLSSGNSLAASSSTTLGFFDATTVHPPQRGGFVYPTPDPSVGCGQFRHGVGYIGGAVFFGG